jgi:predicted Ser/Thr protein kinase
MPHPEIGNAGRTPVASELHPGDPQWIGGYRVVRRLGAGGQGVVYLATSRSGAAVAIKQLRCGPADDRAQQLFGKEVAAARLVAPFCTARVLDARLDGPSPYVVSEYIEGPSLQQYVERHGPMKGVELERLAIGTATALAAIHQAGIVHRDFKPANVMLSESGPRVIDFGIARNQAAETTLSTVISGTPVYMAPEQIRGERVGPATDMFAWASVIAYAATGKIPFGAPNIMAVVHRITSQWPDLSGVPADLLVVLNQCLSKDPDRRPTAQGALALVLGRPALAHDITDPTMVLAEATGLAQATGRPRRARGLATAAVSLIAVLALWALVHQGRDDADQAGSSAAAAPSVTSEPSGAGRRPAASPARARTPSATVVPATQTVPAFFAGDWNGTVLQTIGGLHLWTAKLSLDANRGGGFEIEELGCSGPATVVSAGPFELVLQVVVDDDPNGACVPGGTIHLVRVGVDQASLNWRDDDSRTSRATGLLTRNG